MQFEVFQARHRLKYRRLFAGLYPPQHHIRLAWSCLEPLGAAAERAAVIALIHEGAERLCDSHSESVAITSGSKAGDDE